MMPTPSRRRASSSPPGRRGSPTDGQPPRGRAGVLAVRLLSAFLVAAGLLVGTGCDELSARRSVQEGNKLYYDRKYDKAVARFEEALAKAPQLDIAHYNAGLAHLALFRAGDETPANLAHAEAAIGHFKAYLAKHPNDKKVVTWMIGTYIHSGRYEGAVAYYQDQLQKDPKNTEIMNEISRLDNKAGKLDEASQWQRKRAAAETTRAGKADALYLVGQLRWQQTNKKYDLPAEQRIAVCDDGIGALQEAAELTPDKWKVYLYINLLYRERALAHGVWWARVVEVASALGPQSKAQELKKKEDEEAAAPVPAPGKKVKPAGKK